jgi:hypothetical protein
MERHQLLERLVPLIPPPRAHQVRYHGVLAPCASARDRIVLGPGAPRAAAEGQGPIPAEQHEPARLRPRDCRNDDPVVIHSGLRANANHLADSHSRAGPIRGDPGAADHSGAGLGAASELPRPRRIPWAELLQRVFEVDALLAAPAVAHRCAYSLPSKTPWWRARSSSASGYPRAGRHSAPRRTCRSTLTTPGTQTLSGTSIRRLPAADEPTRVRPSPSPGGGQASTPMSIPWRHPCTRSVVTPPATGARASGFRPRAQPTH